MTEKEGDGLSRKPSGHTVSSETKREGSLKDRQEPEKGVATSEITEGMNERRPFDLERCRGMTFRDWIGNADRGEGEGRKDKQKRRKY